MVQDNVEKSRFELAMSTDAAGGGIAFATYSRSPGVTTVIHTEVPPASSGKGIGSALARGLLDIIRARGEKVIPRCKFIAAFIGKHPEYQDMVATERAR